MPNSHSCCAIMFADVCGSSGLYKDLGNHAAEYKIRQLLSQVMEVIGEHQGLVVKTIGDEVMARFETAEQAVEASIAIQRNVSRQGGALQLRIGLGYGELLLKDDDVFGDTVNDAAFVAHIARAEEIVATSGLFNSLSTDITPRCHEFDRLALKGGADKTLVYRIDWQQPADNINATRVMSVIENTQRVDPQRLTLLTGLQEIEISPDLTPFHFGRSSQVNLMVDSNFASRDHCHLLYRRGKFVLIDHSTNGTYVTPSGQAEIYLRREELPLSQSGEISLGCPSKNSKITVTYSYSNHDED